MDNDNGTMICVDDDGNDGDGGDGKGDGHGHGNGDGDGDADDATTVDGKDVGEDNNGDSRMAIGCRQWDNVDVGRR